jgi:nucleoside-diphosphate-sugar epimerase|tara:strand:- start:64 stop:897 length:834 start_codon:yes stop_codon:yes gene_type:complete
MIIFLTGASGFIGKNFSRVALKEGHFIFAPTRKKKNKKIKNLKWLKGSFDKNWKKELKMSDILVHMAAAGVNDKNIFSEKIFEVNIFKSVKLLNNAIKSKCLNWLIIGSSSEYGRTAERVKTLSKFSKTLPISNYAISKAIFSNLSIELAKKFNCKCRIMRLFPTYGPDEKKSRLWPSLVRAAKSGQNFYIKNPFENRNFNHINDVSKILLNATNFKKKGKKFPQIWHVSCNKALSVKNFAKKVWKDHQATGKLYFAKDKNKKNLNHVSDKNSIWKI